jgi:hypothetical protein
MLECGQGVIFHVPTRIWPSVVAAFLPPAVRNIA